MVLLLQSSPTTSIWFDAKIDPRSAYRTHAVLRCRSDRAVTIAELFINGELVATNEMETNPLHSRGESMPDPCI